MHLPEPANDGEDQPAGPLAVLVELLGERERALQVARDERVGEVVRARRGVGRRELLDVRHRHLHRRMHRKPDLLELA